MYERELVQRSASSPFIHSLNVSRSSTYLKKDTAHFKSSIIPNYSPNMAPTHQAMGYLVDTNESNIPVIQRCITSI